MASFLYIAALIIAAGAVSILGAAFSVFGLSRLFAGAPIAVALMASSLEFSKIVVTAFLHRSWQHLNGLYRTYLLCSVIVLSVITSMGIFGFLSDAYQASSRDLTENQVKIEAMTAEQARNSAEIDRINRDIEEIPAERISRKLKARKDAEPRILELTQKTEQLAKQLSDLNLLNIEIKTKVGPLIYVAKIANADIDSVVKWLILVFVSVFDPLAICLVIATSEALRLKSTQVGAQVPTQHKPVERKIEIVPTASNEPSVPSNQPEVVRMKYADEDTEHEAS